MSSAASAHVSTLPSASPALFASSNVVSIQSSLASHGISAVTLSTKAWHPTMGTAANAPTAKSTSNALHTSSAKATQTGGADSIFKVPVTMGALCAMLVGLQLIF